MKTIQISLRLLRHPASLAAILIVLVNDHWLKGSFPSILTGKLSDFAGLFFFPFLLAIFAGVLVGIPVQKALQVRKGEPGRISWPVSASGDQMWMALAFGVTAVLFLVIKTLPWANSMVVGTFERLTGVRVQLALDPTDLVALASLLPAWWLYRRQRQVSAPLRPGRLAYLALGAAALASLATSAPRIPYVDRVAASGDRIYARYSDGQYSPEPAHQTYSSSDGGLTWQVTSFAALPPGMKYDAEVTLPKQVCRTTATGTGGLECYRITGAETVERSTDGGQTWQVDWHIPAERKAYMRRSNLPLGVKRINTIPRDLAILERSDGAWVAAAMDDEGALVRTPQGEWRRVAVSEAEPTPVQAAGVTEMVLFSLMPESVSILVLAYIAGLGLSIQGWGVILRRVDFPLDRPASHVLRPIITALVIVVLVIVISGTLNVIGISARGGSLMDVMKLAFTYGLLPATPLLLLLGAWKTWRQVIRVTLNPEAARRASRASLVGPVTFLLVTWFPFALWAAGWIQAHLAALLLAAFLGGLALIWASRRISRLGRESTVERDFEARYEDEDLELN